MTIYDVPGKSYYDIFIGRNCFSNVNSDVKSNQDLIFNLYPNRNYHLIMDITSMDQFAYSRKIGENILFRHGNTSILIVNELSTLRLDLSRPQIDYLILNNNSVEYIDALYTNINAGALILDASVRNNVATSIIAEMKEVKEIYSDSLEGALMIDI